MPALTDMAMNTIIFTIIIILKIIFFVFPTTEDFHNCFYLCRDLCVPFPSNLLSRPLTLGQDLAHEDQSKYNQSISLSLRSPRCVNRPQTVALNALLLPRPFARIEDRDGGSDVSTEGKQETVSVQCLHAGYIEYST